MAVSSHGQVLLDALKAFIEAEFGEGTAEVPSTPASSGQRYTYTELASLKSLVELRQKAKEIGCPFTKKAEILAWVQENETSQGEEETDEDVVEEDSADEEDEDEDEAEGEEEDSEAELREELSHLSAVGLRNRARAAARESGKELDKEELKKKSLATLIDLIVDLELGSDDDEEEDESEDDEAEAIDPEEMRTDKKKWTLPKLRSFAEDNGVKIPPKLMNNREGIIDLLEEALGEDE